MSLITFFRVLKLNFSRVLALIFNRVKKLRDHKFTNAHCVEDAQISNIILLVAI